MRLSIIFTLIVLIIIKCEKNHVQDIPYNKHSYRVLKENGCTIECRLISPQNFFVVLV